MAVNKVRRESRGHQSRGDEEGESGPAIAQLWAIGDFGRKAHAVDDPVEKASAHVHSFLSIGIAEGDETPLGEEGGGEDRDSSFDAEIEAVLEAKTVRRGIKIDVIDADTHDQRPETLWKGLAGVALKRIQWFEMDKAAIPLPAAFPDLDKDGWQQWIGPRTARAESMLVDLHETAGGGIGGPHRELFEIQDIDLLPIIRHGHGEHPVVNRDP